jgi:hypothetical protein
MYAYFTENIRDEINGPFPSKEMAEAHAKFGSELFTDSGACGRHIIYRCETEILDDGRIICRHRIFPGYAKDEYHSDEFEDSQFLFGSCEPIGEAGDKNGW